MPDRLSAHPQVIPATPDQEPVLANLLELYAHDFSEFHDLELDPDGRFGYKYLPLYWIESDRHPFLIRMNGNLAGLALVKKGSEVSGDENIWDLTEFFVVRRYRRHGIGTASAHQVWQRFPGLWEVRVMESNHAAHQFWERAVAAFTGETIPHVHVAKGSKQWRVFSFASPQPSTRNNPRP